MRALGYALTKLTSKFGLLSQNACIRLAKETGYKLVDTEEKLGRSLNINEIKSVFADVLPKKCRPKIISTVDEYRQFVGKDSACPPFALGCAFPYAKHKSPLWINTEFFQKSPKRLNSTIAHELEHALEINNRPISTISKKLFLLKYNLLSKIYDVDTYRHEVGALYDGISWNIQRPIIRFCDIDKSLKCFPTIADMAKQCGKAKGEFINELHSIVKESGISGENKGLGTLFALKDVKNMMSMEVPAYKVTGAIDEYSNAFKEGVYSYNTGRAEIFKETTKMLSSERKSYFKNLLLGRLKKPNIYMKEKDILQYAHTKEDKVILKEILGELNSSQKYELIKALNKAGENPNNIKYLKNFLEATKGLPDGGYKNYLSLVNIMGIDSKWFTNPDFIKIACVLYGEPAYLVSRFTNITSLSNDAIKKLSQLAELEDKSEFFSFCNSLGI